MCCALLDLVAEPEPHLRSLASETVLEELLTIMCKNFRCFCPVLCSLSANRGSPPSWVEQRLLQSTRCLLSLMTTNSPRGRLYNTASLCRLPCQKSWRLNLCGVWLPRGFDYWAMSDFCSCCCSTGEGRSPENRVATPAKRGTPLPPSYQGHREAWESVQRYAPSFKQWDPDFHPYTLHLWNSHTLEIFLICHTSTFAAHVGWRSMKA